MEKISSKVLESENWVSFELFDNEQFLCQNEVDDLVLDTYKWVLKLNVIKLKNNVKFMRRVKEALERKN